MSEGYIQFRPLTPADQGFLSEMLFLAFFVPEGAPPFPRSIVDRPDILKYHKDYGRAGDYGFIAEIDQQAIGAIWCRNHTLQDPGYGFVQEGIPELNIALLPEVRGRGVGHELMRLLEEKLRTAEVPGVSLSVDQRNLVAFHLYKNWAMKSSKKKGLPSQCSNHFNTITLPLPPSL